MTVRVTVTVCGLPDACGAWTVMEPVKVPAASAAGSTETVGLAGVVPDPGLTCSQLPPDAVEGLAVKFTLAPLLVTESGCDPGAGPPAW